RLTLELQPAVVDRRFQDRVGAELFELLHDADHFAAANHDADGAPGGVFQRVDRRTAEAGGDFFRFGQLGAGDIVFDERPAPGNDDPFQAAGDAVGQIAFAAGLVLNEDAFVAANF